MRTTPFRCEILIALCMILLTGCAAGERPSRTAAELRAHRRMRDDQFEQTKDGLNQRLLTAVKARFDASPGTPPTVDLLVISGGGDWGAFGAGFLKGWDRVQGPLARPMFDAVTGVSTGALIAPFAFMGDDASIDLIETLYRNPRSNWVEKRPFFFMPSNPSFATIPGLEAELRHRLDSSMIRRIADASSKGRFLLVNTTDLDDGGMWVWDVGHEAQRAVASGDDTRIHQIFLASAGIPGAFPFRILDDTLYVDGGVTANILYGGRVREEESFPATWAAAYPGLPMPKVRIWVIFNNQLRPIPQVTSPAWPGVVSRSLDVSTRTATVTSMRHLLAQAEVSRLKRGATVEVRIAAVPDDFVPPIPGVFMKETMNALADLGEKMGADPNSWLTEIP